MAEVVVLVLGLTQSLIVARTLGVDDFGRAALVMAYPALLFAVFDPQSGHAVTRYLARYVASSESHEALAVTKLAYAVDGILALVAMVLVTISGSWLSRAVIGDGSSFGLLVLYAAALSLVAPATTSKAVLGTFGRFRPQANIRIASAVVRTVAVVALVRGGWGIPGFVVGVAVGLALDVALSIVAAERLLRRELGARWWRARVRTMRERQEVLGFIAYSDLTTLATSLMKQADVVLIGALRGPVDAGYYRLALSVTAPVGNAISPLQVVVAPRFAALAARRDVGAMAEGVRRYFWRIGAPLALALLGGVPMLYLMIPRFAGEEYRGAIAPAQLLLAASAVSVALFWARPLVLALGRVKLLFANGTLVSVATFVGYLLATPPHGAPGMAAVRLVVGAVVGQCVIVFLVLRRIDRSSRTSEEGENLIGEPLPCEVIDRGADVGLD